jgi:Leucine Rich repeat
MNFMAVHLGFWLRYTILGVAAVVSSGCNDGPPIADSKSDIDRLPESSPSVRARGLADLDVLALGRLHQLNYLDFGSGVAAHDARITDQGLKSLSELDLSQLDTLDLGYNTRITNAGVAHVAKMNTISTLLLTACSKITDEGLAPILGMKSLVYLDLRGCQGITDAGLQTLSNKTNLRHLELGGCRNVTERGISQLQESLADLRINKDDAQWKEYFRQYEKS